MDSPSLFGESSGGLTAGGTAGKLLTNTTLVLAAFRDSVTYNNDNYDNR